MLTPRRKAILPAILLSALLSASAVLQATAAPQIERWTRSDPDTDDAVYDVDQLTWRLEFNEEVFNVNANDFYYQGLSSADISVERVNGAAYRVTISGGNMSSRDGTVWLRVRNEHNITNGNGERLPNGKRFGTVVNEQSYHVRNKPYVLRIERHDPTSYDTNRDSVVWKYVFSEPVKNVGVEDFYVNTSASGVTVSAVTQQGSDQDKYLVTASGGDLNSHDGQIRIWMSRSHNVKARDDNASLVTRAPQILDETYYRIDNTRPKRRWLDRHSPTEKRINAKDVTFKVKFDEAVTVYKDHFMLWKGNMREGTGFRYRASSVSMYEENPKEWLISFNDLGEQESSVALQAVGSRTRDLAGNRVIGTWRIPTHNLNRDFFDKYYILDSRPPRLSFSGLSQFSTSRLTPFELNWSEGVIGFTEDDIVLSGPAASSASFVLVGDEASRRNNVYLTATQEGSLTVTVPIGAVSDDHGNYNDEGVSRTVVLDWTAPGVSSIVRQSPTVSPTHSDTLRWRVRFSETVKGIGADDFDLIGTTATVSVEGSGRSGREYDVTARGGDLAGLNGSVTLLFAAGHSVTDAAGNALVNTAPTGTNEPTYVVDNTALRVNSIARQDPTSSQTQADSLKWRVTFSKEALHVDRTDFNVSGTTAGLTVEASGDSGREYDVTASGGDLAEVNGGVTLRFANGQNIGDTVGNSLIDTTPGGANESTYVLDNLAPSVASILRSAPTVSPTSEDYLSWRVTFSEDVPEVETSDFVVRGTTASLAVAAKPGSDREYDVTLSGGDLADLDGTVTLEVAPGQSVRDRVGNALTVTAPSGANDNTYVLDNTAPGVASVVRQTPKESTTNSDSLTWRVKFSEGVRTVDATDFSLSGTTANLSVAAIPGAVGEYDVTASGGDLVGLSGTVGLELASGHDIQDAVGNALMRTSPSGVNENYYAVDNIAPSVSLSGVPSQTTNAFMATMTFSEPVPAIAESDITVVGGTVSAFTRSPTDGRVYTAVVKPYANYAVAILAGAVSDAAGNPGSVGIASGTYASDTSAPTLTSVTRLDPSFSPTGDDRLTWRVSFSEGVRAVDAADFFVNGTTASLSVAPNWVSTSEYDVTASGGDLAGLDGTVSLTLATGQDIDDAAGNALASRRPTGTNHNTFIVDNTAPTVSSIVRRDPSISPTNSDILTWRVRFSEGVREVDASDFSLDGSMAQMSVSVTGISNSEYDVTASTDDPAGFGASVTLNLAPGHNIVDLAGHALSKTIPSGANENVFAWDDIAPTVVSVVRQNPAASTTYADSLTWRVTFSEAVREVDTTDFSLEGTTANLVVAESGTSTREYDVIALEGDLPGLNGPVTLSLEATAQIEDLAGNPLTNTTPSGANDTAYLLDNVAPSVTSIVRAFPTASPTRSDSLTWKVTFSEAVRDLDPSDFTVSGIPTGGFVLWLKRVSASEYDATVWGGDLPGLSGEVTLAFKTSGIVEDLAGNALIDGTPKGADEGTFVLDNAAPRVSSIVRHTPFSTVTKADSVVWRVTFDESVSGVDAPDFVVNGTTASLSVAANGSSTREYDVTASGGDLAGLDGTVTLAFAATQNVEDLVGNALSDTTPVGTNDSFYVVDNSAPRVASILRETPAVSPTNSDRVTWRVTFSERGGRCRRGGFRRGRDDGEPVGRGQREFDRRI